MKSYDKEQILADINMVDIAEACGLSVKTKGKTKLILCPCHNDLHYGSCVLESNGFRCYACGASGDAFTLISVTQNLDLHSDFKEILAFAAREISGNPEQYMFDLSESETDKIRQEKESGINREDLKSLGLDGRSPRNRYIENPGNLQIVNITYSSAEAEKLKNQGYIVKKDIKDENVYNIYKKTKPYTLSTLRYEEPDVFESLVGDKKKEKLENITSAEKIIELIIDRKFYKICKEVLKNETKRISRI